MQLAKAKELSPSSAALIKKANLPFTLHNYCFTNLIGQGGFAEVYLVTNNTFGQQYVAKVMTVDPSEMNESWSVFDAEVGALTSLDHPHIVRLYDHFQEGCQFYMILEYCCGGSLHEEIHRSNGLSFDRFVCVAREITEALLYCHDRGIAHRDIKPGNILLDDIARTRVADFGLSLKTNNGQLYKAFGGSLIYTSPEIFQKKPHDPKAGDVWALGVMFATMATGGSPWQCDSLGELKSLAAQGTMSFKKPIPDIIKDLIYKCVVVDPSQRLTMKQITQHSIFGQPKMPKRRFLSSSQKYGSKQKIQWENITRNVCSENSDSFDMNIEEDFMNSLRLNDNSFGNLGPNGAYGLVPGLVPVKTTSIHTASSIFLHSARKKTNVKGRLKRKKNLRPTVFETFAEIEEVNEE